MAGRIQGITVEIGGDTTKLQTALKGVNSEIRNTQSQLKDVDKLLKLDPGNTELLAQKHRLLGDAVKETKEKLETLKTAAEQANTALANGEITQSQYDGLQREIAETEAKLKNLEEQANKSATALQAFISGLGQLDEKGESATLVLDELGMSGVSQLKESFKTIAIDIGETLIPIIKSLMESLKGVVEWWKNLSDGQRELIVKAGLLVAALSPVLIIIGKLISTVGTIMTIIPKISAALTAVKGAFASLNAVMLANPIILIIAAIAALVVAFIYLWNNCEEFRQFWIDLWEGIKNTFTAVVTAISTFLQNAWSAISNVVTTTWNGIKNTVTSVMNAISGFISTGWNNIKNTVSTVGNAIKNAVTTVWTNITSAVKNAMSNVLGAVKSGFVNVKDHIVGLASEAFNWGKDLIMGIVNGISSAISTALAGGTSSGDIVIPVYLGTDMIDEIVVTAQQRMNLRSGGR